MSKIPRGVGMRIKITLRTFSCHRGVGKDKRECSGLSNIYNRLSAFILAGNSLQMIFGIQCALLLFIILEFIYTSIIFNLSKELTITTFILWSNLWLCCTSIKSVTLHVSNKLGSERKRVGGLVGV